MLKPPVTPGALARRSDVHLRPDPNRVVTQLFVAGEELSSGASRASRVMQRVLAMDEHVVEALLAATLRRFRDRHPHLEGDLEEHFAEVDSRRGAGASKLSADRRMLVGAYATSEYAVEAAGLCNPSIVPHPDQGGLGAGETRFVLSLRAVGEGHISSVEFRTGTVGAGGRLHVDDPGHLVVAGKPCPSTYDRASFRALLDHAGQDGEVVSLVLDSLPPTFTGPELEASIADLRPQVLTRFEARETVERARVVARSNYAISFPASSEIGQRVIRPHGPTESRGMEDARFVRFVDDDGNVTYYATYTAFDGARIAPQLLQTRDFQDYRVTQLTGRAAANKGMALFPRRIGGRYVALSRWDRECNAIVTSSDLTRWDDPVEVQAPEQPWELVQLGNCGSPIETSEGWLVFTHGVGPMRTYSIGAVLLDLDHPSTVVGKLALPLLSPDPVERDGSVPNVVYSCGAMLHQGTIVLPYAHGDSATAVATVPLADLLECLLAP
ncbi:MAG: glycoside hydrolase family 130 protein [Acidimicrobiales bacterium]